MNLPSGSGAPSMARLTTRPSATIMARTCLRKAAFSLIVSATMWRAPSSASSGGMAKRAAEFGERGGVGLLPEVQGERFESLLAGDGGLGPALGLVRQVEIFEFGLLQRGFDFGLQLGGELALLLDGGEHGFAAVFELAEVFELLLDIADLDFVEIAGGFLAVARDEGNRGAVVEKFDNGGEPLHGYIQQFGNMNEYGRRKGFQSSHDPVELP